MDSTIESFSRESSVFVAPEYSITYGADHTLQWKPLAGSKELAIALSYHFPSKLGLEKKMQAAIKRFMKDEKRKASARSQLYEIPGIKANATTSFDTIRQEEGSGSLTLTHGDVDDVVINTSQAESPAVLNGFNISALPRVLPGVQRSIFAASHNNHIPQSSAASQSISRDSELEMVPWAPTTPSRKKRRYGAEEAVQVAANRGNACNYHREKKSKCNPKNCMQNRQNLNRVSKEKAQQSHSNLQIKHKLTKSAPIIEPGDTTRISALSQESIQEPSSPEISPRDTVKVTDNDQTLNSHETSTAWAASTSDGGSGFVAPATSHNLFISHMFNPNLAEEANSHDEDASWTRHRDNTTANEPRGLSLTLKPPTSGDNWLDNFLGDHQVEGDPDLPSSYMTALSVSSQEKEEDHRELIDPDHEELSHLFPQGPFYLDHQNRSRHRSHLEFMEPQHSQATESVSPPTREKKNDRSTWHRDKKAKNEKSSRAKSRNHRLHSETRIRQVIEEKDKHTTLSNTGQLFYVDVGGEQQTQCLDYCSSDVKKIDGSKKKGESKHRHHQRNFGNTGSPDIDDLTNAFTQVQLACT